MGLENAFVRGLRCLALLAAVLAPLASPGQADKKAVEKKYQREMAKLYESLAITDVEMPQGVLRATDTFRPTFKIANLTDNTLAIPPMAGLPADVAFTLGKTIFTIRRVGGPKREPPRVYMTSAGPSPAPTIEPKAVLPAPSFPGLTIKGMALPTGDYELTIDFGIDRGPKVKSVVRKFRVENATTAAELAKERAANMQIGRQPFDGFAQSIFAVTKPGEFTLSNLEVKVGAPLQATYIIEKAGGKEVPAPDDQNKQYALNHQFRLTRSAGAKVPQQVWIKTIFLNWDSLAVLRERGSFTMSLPIETVGLAPGAYELSVEVLNVGGVDNAPRPQKLRFTVVK